MKTKKIILAMFFALSLPLFATAQIKIDEIPSIDVNMSSDTLVVADIFNVKITITDKKGAGKAGIENAENKHLIPILKSAGIDVKKDLEISDFDSYYNKSKTVATKTYILKVKSVKVLNEITRKLTKADILISVTGTEVSNRNEIEVELKAKAMKSSRIQAINLLSSVNCKVGKLLKVSFSGRASNVSNDQMLGGSYTRTKMATSSNIDKYMKVRLSSYVNVTYEIIN